MAFVLDGRYEVYYDKEKTKLMAKIGFSKGLVNGKFERYNLDGTLAYETNITLGDIDGILRIYKKTKMVIQIIFETGTVTMAVMNLKYSYTINYDEQEKPDGLFEIKNGDAYVLDGTITRRVFERVRYYNNVGDLKTELRFNDNGNYHGINRYYMKLDSEINYTYTNGFRESVGNVTKFYTTNRDMELRFSGNTLIRAGKEYEKL